MIIELSILFAFCAMICWGFGDFLIQRTVRKIGDVEALFLKSVLWYLIDESRDQTNSQNW